MDFLTKILNNNVHFPSAIISAEEAQKYKKDFDVLYNLGLLEKISDPQHIWCKTCENESIKVHSSGGRFFTLCTQNEYAERDYFSPEELKQWRFNTPHFISLFLKTLGIKQINLVENFAGLLWDVGTQEINGTNYHIFFCRNIDEIEKSSKVSIITHLPHSVVFYTGIPHISLPEKMLPVPITDFILGITNKGILLKKEIVNQFFLKNVFATREADFELDDNMVLQDGYILFEPLRGGVFKKRSKKIRPLAIRIIDHLYGIRNYKVNSKSIDEIADALTSTQVSVLNEIGRIEKTSSENNLPDILHKYANGKRGINPQLSCCK